MRVDAEYETTVHPTGSEVTDGTKRMGGVRPSLGRLEKHAEARATENGMCESLYLEVG